MFGFLCSAVLTIICLFVPFLLAISLSVLIQIRDFDESFGILKPVYRVSANKADTKPMVPSR